MMQKQVKTRKDEAEGCESDWSELVKAWMKACQRCHWWGNTCASDQSACVAWLVDQRRAVGVSLRREAGEYMSVPCCLQYNGSIEALIRQAVWFTARAMDVRCALGPMSPVSFRSQCLDVSEEVA